MNEKKIGRRHFLKNALPATADTVVQVVESRAGLLPEERQEAHVPIKVRIVEEDCIAFKGPECGACVGLCPQGVRAIQLSRWRPVLDAAACVGCGECIGACPTSPPAIVAVPLTQE